ncbi:MAG: hypothetical protein ACFNUC_03670 [Selenomonas noxia]
MTYATTSNLFPLIDVAQKTHLVTASLAKHLNAIPKSLLQMPYIEPFRLDHSLLGTAQKIAAQQSETIAALQRIPQIAINQVLLEQSAKMTATIQNIRTSIAASGITATLELSEALRNIPIAHMQRLLSICQHSYMPPLVAYGCSEDARSSTVEHHQQTRKGKPTHPRPRLIKRIAKQELVQISAAALVLIQTTSPEMLESVKAFSQNVSCDNLLAILGPSAAIIAEQLTPNDRKALLWIVWILTIFLICSK